MLDAEETALNRNLRQAYEDLAAFTSEGSSEDEGRVLPMMSFSPFEHDFCVRLPGEAQETIGFVQSQDKDQEHTYCTERLSADSLTDLVWPAADPSLLAEADLFDDAFYSLNVVPQFSKVHSLPFKGIGRRFRLFVENIGGKRARAFLNRRPDRAWDLNSGDWVSQVQWAGRRARFDERVTAKFVNRAREIQGRPVTLGQSQGEAFVELAQVALTEVRADVDRLFDSDWSIVERSRARRLLVALDAERRVSPSVRASRHVPPLLLASPHSDGADGDRPMKSQFQSRRSR